MNIFVLHLDPKKCAEYHCDRHVVKMILETRTILNTAHEHKAWQNHPCCKWVRESKQNYEWLCSLGLELCYEYTRRYNKVHSMQASLEQLAKMVPDLPNLGLTPHYLAMPNDCKTKSTVKSYRNYYNYYKQHLGQWKTKIPKWFTPYQLKEA